MNLAGKTQRKNAAMVDSDDDNSSESSSSTMRSDRMSVSGTEEVEFNKDSLLDEAVDALYGKRLDLVIYLLDEIWCIWMVSLFTVVKGTTVGLVEIVTLLGFWD